VFFQIKPFKDNDRAVSHRETVVKNLISLKRKKIIFLVRGNSSNIRFFVAVPRKFKQHFQNTFYSNYPTTDLQEIVDLPMAKNKTFIKFRRRSNIANLRNTAVIADKTEFTRDGTYMDPMNDIMSLYNTIDAESNLDLYFTYVFKRRKSIPEYSRQFLKRARNIKKKSDDDLGDEPKTSKSEKEDLELSVGFKITSKDPYMIESTKVNIRSAFSPFVSNGKVRFRNREKFMPMTYSQVVNFFHIPTMENFYK